MEAFEELLESLSGPAAVDAVVVSSKPTSAVAPPAPAIKRTVEEKRERSIRSLESDLLEKSLAVAMDSMRAFEIAPDQENPPEEWVKELGIKGAVERFRTAKMALMSKKEAPVALDVAKTVAMGIIRARSVEKVGPKVLNVQFVNLPTAVLPPIPVLDLTSESE